MWYILKQFSIAIKILTFKQTKKILDWILVEFSMNSKNVKDN